MQTPTVSGRIHVQMVNDSRNGVGDGDESSAYDNWRRLFTDYAKNFKEVLNAHKLWDVLAGYDVSFARCSSAMHV
jgi:hypothetical protein